MTLPAKTPPPDEPENLTPLQRALSWVYVAGLVLLGIMVNTWLAPQASVEVDYSDFKALVRDAKVQSIEVSPSAISGIALLNAAQDKLSPAARQALSQLQKQDPVRFITARIEDPHLIEDLERAGVRFAGAPNRSWIGDLISWLAPVLLLIVFWTWGTRRFARAAGGADLVGVGKSKAKVIAQKNIEVRFTDVEGIDEAKAELLEVVEFLRRPDRYTKLGAHIPKGILIVGAPGTGKTLLAKAVAGEANVPFLSISGSEFVEMFVGVGAARVRDLFQQAEQLAPCIIFIDELDALGKARGVGSLGGNEEREQTLNQLLVEIDGFNSNQGVLIMAATNRPEILDPALLRPGRFDRHVAIDRPDIQGRERILRLHVKRLTLAPDVDLRAVAAKTPGSAGADLANMVNEAALHAARENKTAVDMADFEAAIDRAVAGLEKKGRVMNPREKQTVAYHEAGHALIAELRTTTDRVAKVSIIPRGIGALGFTQQLPTEDRYLLKYSELLDRLDVLMGGRLAEMLIFNEVSTGAQNDLQRATDLARHMVAQYGMSETLGPAVLDIRGGNAFLGENGVPLRREYSEYTARRIDAEVQRLLRDAAARVRTTLNEHRAELESLAQLLLEQETVERDALTRILSTQRTPALPTSSTTAAACNATPGTSQPLRSYHPPLHQPRRDRKC